MKILTFLFVRLDFQCDRVHWWSSLVLRVFTLVYLRIGAYTSDVLALEFVQRVCNGIRCAHRMEHTDK